MAEEISQTELACPVCRAVQHWSDECRRCKCDLRLLRQAEETCNAIRERALLALHARQWTDALREARDYRANCPGEESRRLLAVCCLHCGNFREAITIATDLV